MTNLPAMTSLKDYATVTAAYWGFTLTDGALRMLVLLHFHRLGYSPLDIAILFLLYEAMGVVTNFVGGWVGSRFGLRITLFVGLAVQIVALVMLSLLDPGWVAAMSVAYVMTAQALSGIAKDLTKMSSKSAVKLVVASGDQGGLFKWVAVLTGSKNALKGVGFLLGGVMLQTLGFVSSLWVMAAGLGLVLTAALILVRADLGRAKEKVKARELFSKTREINILSAARVFLFASRDVWFVVGVPIFLYDQLGWTFDQVGAFMAVWVIGYGMVQAVAPRMLGRDAAARAPRLAKVWGAGLAVIPAVLAAAMMPASLATLSDATGWALPAGLQSLLLIGGLMLFGVVFALNSSIHSYLIVAYSDADKVALNVGFYYMANAIGRFGGTLLSGLLYQFAGLPGALWMSAGLLAMTVAITLALPRPAASDTSELATAAALTSIAPGTD
ncbi:organoarsenical effux MFS transporter ArsJ [Thalassobaculum salexigens]|uniref:organoarsenical effux MFS transporter ArsJ n=1 Tax=Thalassobaculum salexigens TaxID=455360 RepID=UPI0004232613|nr:organoarsenical effux MFS transporter ArsJ [Thalassobaculum salexigens]